jgi:hypothetical protein
MKTIITSTALSAIILCAHSVTAAPRAFSYVYEASVAAAGSHELENSAKWLHTSMADDVEFQHELEFGLTSNVQLSLILAEWATSRVDGGGRSTDYIQSGAHVVWQLADPSQGELGIALYGEGTLGSDMAGLEGKLILQKNFDTVTVVSNTTLESDWVDADDGDPSSYGMIEQSVGASVRLNDQWSLGAEAIAEFPLTEWSDSEDARLSVGPTVGFRSGPFWAVASAYFQVTDVDAAPDVQARLVFGVSF